MYNEELKKSVKETIENLAIKRSKGVPLHGAKDRGSNGG